MRVALLPLQRKVPSCRGIGGCVVAEYVVEYVSLTDELYNTFGAGCAPWRLTNLVEITTCWYV